MNALGPQSQTLIGSWRRFGRAGPVYEIMAVGGSTPAGEQMMRVRLVESGEEVDYRLSEILDDPRER